MDNFDYINCIYTFSNNRKYTEEQIIDMEESWSLPRDGRTFNPIIPRPINEKHQSL